jgi:hypothetical protein
MKNCLAIASYPKDEAPLFCFAEPIMTIVFQRTFCFSPLEQFIRDYVEAVNGTWDEIEPQVYDLLTETELLQVTFDPEALPEHPRAQLASFGSPLIDRLLDDAAKRWSAAQVYRVGLNLHVKDLHASVNRAVLLPRGSELRIERVRAMNFPQAVFWFKAVFSGDQKEEEILPIGIDLHYKREVRQLETLLADGRLSTSPEAILAEARHAGLVSGYRTARRHVVRTVTSLANGRRREWASRLEKQIARTSYYYAQLREEADEYARRSQFRTRKPEASSSEDDPAALAGTRREAIDREQSLRIAELRQRSSVRVEIKLCSVMLVEQPKLQIAAAATVKERCVGRLDLVWDPLWDGLEAVPCTRCGQPSFEFRIERGDLVCANCPVVPPRTALHGR